MKRTATVTLFFYLFLVTWIPSAEASLPIPKKNNFESKVLSTSAISAISTSIARADKALVQSSIASNQLRGAFGESAMHMMMGSQGYSYLSPRLGSQGIDGIFLRYDSKGNPSSLIVGEAKYGSSKLGMTKDGWQLSDRWTNNRLAALSKRYEDVSSLKSVPSSKLPTRGEMPRHMIEVDLGNGQKVKFWRRDANDYWKYDGPPETLQVAQKKAGVTAKFLEGASSGKIKYRKALFQYKLDGNTLKVGIGDCSKLDAKGRTFINDTFEINLNNLAKADSLKTVENELIRQIRRKFPHFSQADTVAYAKEIMNNSENIQKAVEQAKVSLYKSLGFSTISGGIFGGLFVGGIEAFSELIKDGHINPMKVLKNSFMGFASSAFGVLSGQGTVIFLTKSQLGHSASECLNSFLRLPSTALCNNMLGSLIGGSVATIAMVLAGSMLGFYDGREACRIATGGIIGTTAGTFMGSATIGIASVFGTTSTGTSIASLSGAAATKASLAWLGGGAVSAGGGGVAVGTLVVSGAVIVGVMVIPIITLWGFHLYDEYQENKRMNLIMASMIDDRYFLIKSVENCISF